jgi:hypothetical protein
MKSSKSDEVMKEDQPDNELSKIELVGNQSELELPNEDLDSLHKQIDEELAARGEL